MQIDGENVETASDFILLSSKINEDGNCSHEIKRHFLHGRVLKCRDITLPTKGHIVKTIVFPVVICRCEDWRVWKPEYQKIDAFALWC